MKPVVLILIGILLGAGIVAGFDKLQIGEIELSCIDPDERTVYTTSFVGIRVKSEYDEFTSVCEKR